MEELNGGGIAFDREVPSLANDAVSWRSRSGPGADGKRDEIVETKSGIVFAMGVSAEGGPGADGKRDAIVEVNAAGIFAMGVSTVGPASSSSPSFSALMISST